MSRITRPLNLKLDVVADYITELEERVEMLEIKNAYLMTRCEEAESKIATFQSILKEF